MTTIPMSAKTNASGNQRSVQAEIARPKRTGADSPCRSPRDMVAIRAPPLRNVRGREFPDLCDRLRVLQRREVTEVGLAEVRAADHPAQDLRVARLRQLGHEPHGLRAERPAEALHDHVRDLAR